MSSADPLQEAIQAWTRRQSGTWSAAQEKKLQTWLAATAEHREAYEKVARAWGKAGDLKHSLPDEMQREYEHARQRSVARARFGSVGTFAVAAGLALLALGVGFRLWPTATRWWSGPEISLVSAKGQTKSFTLEDGTQVLLDADSQLIVHIGHYSRKAVLVRGEALINVAHDRKRPLEVTLGIGRIQDLGTRFDIEALPDSSRIEVLEGRVGVLTPRGRALLVAGQSSGYDRSGNLQAVRSLNATTAQWSQGQRHFDREPLGDVLERLTRYHAMTFVYTDPGLRNLRVSGTFRTSDQELFLRTLAGALPIEVRYLSASRVEIATRTANSGATDAH
jgi:transmembrane sensor